MTVADIAINIIGHWTPLSYGPFVICQRLKCILSVGGRTWSVRMRMTSMTAKLAARAIVATVAVHTLHLLLSIRERQYSSGRLD
jgi:hypothetical protein